MKPSSLPYRVLRASIKPELQRCAQKPCLRAKCHQPPIFLVIATHLVPWWIRAVPTPRASHLHPNVLDNGLVHGWLHSSMLVALSSPAAELCWGQLYAPQPFVPQPYVPQPCASQSHVPSPVCSSGSRCSSPASLLPAIFRMSVAKSGTVWAQGFLAAG